MELNDITSASADHERGAWLELAHPITGELTGMRLRVAGPDSETQAKARLQMADDLGQYAELDGTLTAEKREKARIDCLARCVLEWDVSEDGTALPLTHKNVVRLLRAGLWVQAQVDAFAGDRRNFGGL